MGYYYVMLHNILFQVSIVQAYGQRSRFVSQRGDDQVSAMRHGATKVRVGLIDTNLPEAKQAGWVAETSRIMSRQPHAKVRGIIFQHNNSELTLICCNLFQMPLTSLPHNATVNDRVEYLWGVFFANINILTLDQRTVNWFLARMFCFSSTAFHILINAKAAVYLNTSELRSLHSSILQILRLHPITAITLQNAPDRIR